MAAKNESEETKEEQQSGTVSKKKMLIIILLITVPLILGFVVVGGLLLMGGGDAITKLFEDPVGATQPDYIVPIKDFQVNLADSGGRRFLRTNFLVGFDEKKIEKELERREYEFRSEIIALLRAKTVEDLQEPGGMDRLEDEIISALNDMLVTGEIKRLYFIEFILQ